MEESKEVVSDIAPVEQGPSRSKDLSKTLPEEAFNNFLQGKRHMLVQDYTYAVQSLSKACELYATHFGELAIECGDVHFLYGKALFRLSQQNAGVLGGALNEDVTEDEKTSEDENENKENESDKNDSDAENEEEDENSKEGKSDENDMEAESEKEPSESTDSPQAPPEEATKDPEESSKGPEESSKEPEEKTVAEEKKENGEGESKDEEEAKEPEEDDLELAWNSLETAKTIFMRQGEDNVEAQLKVADILQLLAEISMESDNNPAAIADLKECLKIKKRHLKEDDRLLAETYYQMGLAELLNKDYTEAIENFEITLKILQLRIDNLKSTPVVETEGSFEHADIEKEIEDLESVILDIKEKIEDTKELIKNAKIEIKEALAGSSQTTEVGFATKEQLESSTKPVSNITHLLKRKKPEQDEAKDNDPKRVKLESSVANGDTTVDKK